MKCSSWFSHPQIYLAYGSLVSRALTPDCLRSLPTKYDVKISINRTVQHLAGILQQFFVNPCMCRSCKNAYSWFKIPAMLLACFCLLMWLSLVGRRAYLRRVHFPTVRGAACCSLTDLDYLGSNLDYVVRPRAFSGTRLSQSHRVQLYSPSRTVIRGTRVAQNSSQPEGSRRFPNSPGIFGNDSNSAPWHRRSPSPPPPSYASLLKPSVEICSSETEHVKVTSTDPTTAAVAQGPVDSVDRASKPPPYSDILALSQSAMETSPGSSRHTNTGESDTRSSSHSMMRTQADA
ncbi:hypothetical protein FBUS_10263 [Fasciolopsis buskii]|uniref:Uncharacterized protein n=1 Tax=Fasciolopsis buskii TaxID=27845 RepID=A0A8E0RQG9_9TREM|nr:hypothetical protein FBUS_10263 [Fasciolopsis buski]